MAETFRISFDVIHHSAMRSATFFDFVVAADDGSRHYARVVTPLGANPEAWAPAVLERLELELRPVGSGLFVADGEDVPEVKLWGEPEEILGSRSPGKECVWQVRGQREWACRAHIGEGGDP